MEDPNMDDKLVYKEWVINKFGLIEFQGSTEDFISAIKVTDPLRRFKITTQKFKKESEPKTDLQLLTGQPI